MLRSRCCCWHSTVLTGTELCTVLALLVLAHGLSRLAT